MHEQLKHQKLPNFSHSIQCVLVIVCLLHTHFLYPWYFFFCDETLPTLLAAFHHWQLSAASNTKDILFSVKHDTMLLVWLLNAKLLSGCIRILRVSTSGLERRDSARGIHRAYTRFRCILSGSCKRACFSTLVQNRASSCATVKIQSARVDCSSTRILSNLVSCLITHA